MRGTSTIDLMHRHVLRKPLLAVTFGLLLSMSAQAGLFDDEEARKQIVQLRAQMADTQRAIDARVGELEAQAKNRSIIDLFNQVETLKTEFAKLRGQIELLQNEMENTQKRQRDLYVDLDGRLRKVEAEQAAAAAARAAAAAAAQPPPASMPPSVVGPAGTAASAGAAPPGAVDPNRAMPPGAVVAPPAAFDPIAEQRAYDQGLEHFRAGRFAEAVTAFQLFTRNFPRSTLVPSAQYWIGNSLYATRDFRGAITIQRQLIAQYPDSAKASDALLNIASAQSELGDLQAARTTLQEVASKYPATEAGAKAKQRLGIR
jgi:tol-pal system protein YbgF